MVSDILDVLLSINRTSFFMHFRGEPCTGGRNSGRTSTSSGRHPIRHCGRLSPVYVSRQLTWINICLQAQKKVRAPAPGGGGRGGAGANILQFYGEDSPGLQVGPTTVLVASLSFVGIVVLLHIIGKFRSS